MRDTYQKCPQHHSRGCHFQFTVTAQQQARQSHEKHYVHGGCAVAHPLSAVPSRQNQRIKTTVPLCMHVRDVYTDETMHLKRLVEN